MYLSFVEWDEYNVITASRFTCVKFILNTNSHHQYECIEMMYTNLAIPILYTARSPPTKGFVLTTNDLRVPIGYSNYCTFGCVKGTICC